MKKWVFWVFGKKWVFYGRGKMRNLVISGKWVISGLECKTRVSGCIQVSGDVKTGGFHACRVKTGDSDHASGGFPL